MSNEELTHEEIEFERQDLSAGGILGFLAGLAIVGLLIHIILVVAVQVHVHSSQNDVYEQPDNRQPGQETQNAPGAQVLSLELDFFVPEFLVTHEPAPKATRFADRRPAAAAAPSGCKRSTPARTRPWPPGSRDRASARATAGH